MRDDTSEMTLNDAAHPDHLWSIILAGGDGERVKPFVEQRLGCAKPKQYCAFVGTRSLFQHTVDRALRLTEPARTLIVIARTHQNDCREQLLGRPPVKILLQPENRDTAPGLFLPLTHIHAQDPDATVVIYPSDHFVCPEDRFVEIVRHAGLAADRLVDKVIILGARPDNLELEYGWIQPGRTLAWANGFRVREVQRFVEKPSQRETEAVRASGGIWNTCILAAKVETLWQLGWQVFPDMMVLFHELKGALNSPGEAAVLNEIYRTMPVRNLSVHLLQHIPDRLAMIMLDGVLWSDWGSPGRISDTLDRIAKPAVLHQESHAAR
jgi:mannose-1-phosphate guanylyltransferase